MITILNNDEITESGITTFLPCAGVTNCYKRRVILYICNRIWILELPIKEEPQFHLNLRVGSRSNLSLRTYQDSIQYLIRPYKI